MSDFFRSIHPCKLAPLSPKMIITTPDLFIFLKNQDLLDCTEMIEYNRIMINKQKGSSFSQQIFIEYLKHNSAYLGASDCVVNTAFKASAPWSCSKGV